MIDIRNVSVCFDKKIHALKNINLFIGKGEFIFLVGPTGTGKSTLLKLLYREEQPTEGKVFVLGHDVNKLRRRNISKLRRSMGVVFQDFRLLPDKTAWENIAFALYVTGANRRYISQRVPEVLDLVGLIDRRDAYPKELSGGEQQRICIARAIVNNPPLLIADEPTGNLDPTTSLDIIQLLERINDTGTTVIVASHDQHIVDMMKKRVVALQGGNMIRDEIQGGYNEL